MINLETLGIVLQPRVGRTDAGCAPRLMGTNGLPLGGNLYCRPEFVPRGNVVAVTLNGPCSTRLYDWVSL